MHTLCLSCSALGSVARWHYSTRSAGVCAVFTLLHLQLTRTCEESRLLPLGFVPIGDTDVISTLICSHWVYLCCPLSANMYHWCVCVCVRWRERESEREREREREGGKKEKDKSVCRDWATAVVMFTSLAHLSNITLHCAGLSS